MAKEKDLIGKKFNYLTLIQKDIEKSTQSKRSYWICKCDCGNFKTIRESSILSNNTKSCGCLNKQKIKNISNQKFGRLTAIEPTDRREQGHVIWKCLCECGNIFYTSSTKLISGNTKSCGCIKYNQNNPIDYTGYKNGKLTVLKRMFQKDKFGRSLWECQCECGSKVIIPGSNLKTTYSCGCINSKGEEKISTILKQNNIIFEKEKTFSSCRFPETNKLARFDFYLPDFNVLIEFDGKQHYIGWNGEQENLQTIQNRDLYKNNWCKQNNITLIRIPYTILNIELKDLLNESQYII